MDDMKKDKPKDKGDKKESGSPPSKEKKSSGPPKSAPPMEPDGDEGMGMAPGGGGGIEDLLMMLMSGLGQGAAPLGPEAMMPGMAGQMPGPQGMPMPGGGGEQMGLQQILELLALAQQGAGRSM